MNMEQIDKIIIIGNDYFFNKYIIIGNDYFFNKYVAYKYVFHVIVTIIWYKKYNNTNNK